MTSVYRRPSGAAHTLIKRSLVILGNFTRNQKLEGPFSDPEAYRAIRLN